MSFMEWNKDFLTGIKEFDDDHQHLVGLLNKAYDDFIVGSPDDSVLEILNELIKYASHHFVAEEKWLTSISYQKLAEHKHEHDSFTKSVRELQDAFHNGSEHVSLDVLTFLKKWVRSHMLESDAAYSKLDVSLVSADVAHKDAD